MRNHWVLLPLSPRVSLFVSASVSVSLCLSLSVSLCLSLSLALPLAPPGNHDKSDFISLFCLYGLSTNNAVFKLQFRTFYINSSLGSLEFNSGRLCYRPIKSTTTSGEIRGGCWEHCRRPSSGLSRLFPTARWRGATSKLLRLHCRPHGARLVAAPAAHTQLGKAAALLRAGLPHHTLVLALRRLLRCRSWGFLLQGK